MSLSRKNRIMAITTFFCLLIILTLAKLDREQNVVAAEYKDSVAQDIIIPCVDDVREYGYPKNESEETYGPDVKELDSGPDLILVRYGNGYGYIRKSEMDDGVESPKDAVAKMRKEDSRKINVYLQDGITCIGTFALKGERQNEKDG